jgi:phosphoglycolate phosphatase-like HAD superfamily hydrolase
MLILDFDGVIIESNSVKTEAFRHVFGSFPEYAQTMMDFHHAHISLSRFGKFEHMLKLMGRTGDTALMAEIATKFSNYMLENLTYVFFVPGAEAFLEKMHARHPLYLISVTPAEELDTILSQRGLKRWFRDVYGCPPWTKPDAIRDVLAREAAAPGDAILIGDSAGDQRAAQMVGLRFLARNSGLKFDDPQPLTFADLNEISDFMENVFTWKN